MKFDPMTGEPIVEEETKEPVQQKRKLKFDPMTGEPIVEEETKEPAQQERKPKFDPKTGEPIYDNAAEALLAKHKKVSAQKSTIAIIAVAAVVLVVLVGVIGGLFQTKQMKIIRAVSNTFADKSKLMEACTKVDLADAFTLYVNADIEGEEVEATFASKKNQMQLSGIVDVSGAPEIEGIIGIDSKEVRAKIEGLDTVVVYNFTKENDGDLIDELDDDAVELINDCLVTLTSDKEQGKVATKVSKAMLKSFNEWEIENADKKSFEVDGKKRNCKGYSFTIEEDNMEDMADAILQALEGEVNDEVLEMYEDSFAESFNDMPDVDVTVYIYKDMLAAVILECDGEEVEITFEGGAYRTQNVKVETDSYTVMELKGETKGSVEEYELELGGREVFSMEYDAKSGELEAKENYTGYNIKVEAILIGKSNEVSFVLEDIDTERYSINCDLEIKLKKGAKMQSIKGEEFDLGAADEDDIEDLADDIIDALD